MDKRQGYEFAVERGLVVDRGNFYRLFKNIARIKTLTPAEKIVLSVILSYTDNGQEFYMSNNILAVEVGMNYSSVVRIITSLRKLGYVKTYKVMDRSKNLVVGRTVVPQKNLMMTEIEKNWNEYEYEEYGIDEQEE